MSRGAKGVGLGTAFGHSQHSEYHVLHREASVACLGLHREWPHFLRKITRPGRDVETFCGRIPSNPTENAQYLSLERSKGGVLCIAPYKVSTSTTACIRMTDDTIDEEGTEGGGNSRVFV